MNSHQSQQSNLEQTFVIVIFEGYFVESEHVFVNRCGIKGKFKMPRATISRYFLFVVLIRIFFFLFGIDLKRMERSRTAELADF